MSLRWLTPALSQSHAADAAGDEYSLEYGRVRVTREEREDSAATSLVTVTTWAVVDPVALGDQGFYLCQVRLYCAMPVYMGYSLYGTKDP